jgi:hypothetical protein
VTRFARYFIHVSPEPTKANKNFSNTKEQKPKK